MQTLRALLIDLDGVIYQDEEVVPGASDALAWVRARAIPHAFITNTTSRPRRALVEKLVRFGVPARDEQIFTPAVAAAEWLRREASGPAALFVPEATKADFAGVPALAGTLGIVQRMTLYGMWLNLVLAFFNLIPIPPLDGSHVFYHLLPPGAGPEARNTSSRVMVIFTGLPDFCDRRIASGSR